MSNTTAVDVIFTGKVIFGADPQQAAAELSRLTGLPADKALAVITGGQPRLAMQGLTLEHGRAWLSRLTAIGVEANLSASSKPAAQSFGPPPETPTPTGPQGLAAMPGGQGPVTPPSGSPGPGGPGGPTPGGAGPVSGGGGQPMGFGEAIATCFRKYANCGGRASRSEFWWFQLFKFLLCFVPYLLAVATDKPLFLIPAALAALVLLIPDLCVQIRRLHDQDKSGWFVLLSLIPFVGGIILIILYMLPGTPGPNRFDGDQPSYAGVFIGCGVAALLMVIILAAIAIPQFAAYRMRAFNTSAASDIRNLKTAQEVLMGDYRVYGATREGDIPGSGAGMGDILTGPLNAATSDSSGAMLSAEDAEGETRAIGIGVGNNVSLVAHAGKTASGTLVFYAYAKHKETGRVFLTTSETTAIFFCENKKWVGQSDIPDEATEAFTKSDDYDPAGHECGGSPERMWQAL